MARHRGGAAYVGSWIGGKLRQWSRPQDHRPRPYPGQTGPVAGWRGTAHIVEIAHVFLRVDDRLRSDQEVQAALPANRKRRHSGPKTGQRADRDITAIRGHGAAAAPVTAQTGRTEPLHAGSKNRIRPASPHTPAAGFDAPNDPRRQPSEVRAPCSSPPLGDSD